MKKIGFLFVLLSLNLFPYSFAGGKAFSIMGKFYEGSETTTTTDSTGFYFEFYPKAEDVLEAGIGIKYNSYKEQESKDSFANVTTLYGVARFRKEVVGMYPFIQIKGGYPYSWDGDLIPAGENLKGQAFASIGVGAQIAYLDFSLNYETNLYNLEKETETDKRVFQSYVNASLGFKY